MPGQTPAASPAAAALSPRGDHARRLPPAAWERRWPMGAEVVPGGGVHFRVWAPDRGRVEVVWSAGGSGAPLPLDREAAGGWFSGFAAGGAAGDLYRFRLDGGAAVPDPASRFQPGGPHGPSQVVDPAAFRWTDDAWRGASLPGQVIYEMHVGTCTPEGTWAAAERLLPGLAALGVTALEVMPVAEFAGRFGWGYDGVDLFAPTRLYGSPDDFRRFVDRAHATGLAVLLDVVYNHFGPDGNYLRELSHSYFTDLHGNEWGEAIHFYGAPEVRQLFVANAAHWIAEYHLDGLRLDATQDIHDRSPEHILAEVARAARAAGAALPPGRSVLLVAESEPQDSRLVRPPAAGGYGLDALWSDDFHHSARVALTGRAGAYYSDYQGSPRELVAATRFGPLFQGQRYSWQDQRRGTPAAGVARRAFVSYLENHDQVSNSARGARLHELASPGSLRALTALLLLGPGTPLLFQGQESGAPGPWVYFADHHPELAAAVRRGRLAHLSQFPGVAGEVARRIPPPESPHTFELCKLEPFPLLPPLAPGAEPSAAGDPAGGAARRERERRNAALALHRDLLRLRRADPVFRLQDEAGLDGAVLGPAAFVLRFHGSPPAPGGEVGGTGGADGMAATAAGGMAEDRLLVVNLGRDLELAGPSEPLLAPPLGCRWETLWSSEAAEYGGSGAPPAEDERGVWRIPGQAALALRPVRLAAAPATADHEEAG